MSEADQREEAIFEAALPLESAERVAYLDQACAGDPVLRARIESLLGALERAGGLLNEPAVPRDAAAQPAALTPASQSGELIGPYKLLQQIGEGGCGVVYMAEQLQPVKRRVALKILKLGMDTKQVIARFEAERQALALMDHPNIAKVLDAGATQSGRPYFVMELVRGVKITEFCDDNQLPMRQRLELFIQVCQAVQHAHQKGVIHRDLKPSNILVTVNDGVPVPRVIDFGIAKATTGQPLTDKTLFTAFEQFIGTPAYMSPEQAVMTSLDIDTRSDIFDTKELLQAGLDEMRRTIREREPARPSTRLSTLLADELTTTAKRRQTEAPKLVHSVRGDLDWIVMKCLEKDRARRYETANGLARDVERHLHNEPVLACPPGAAYRFKKLVRRNKGAVATAAVVTVTLLIGLGVSVWQAVEKSRAYRRAVASEQKSAEVARFLRDMLDGVGPSVARGRDTALLLEIVDKTAARVGQDLNGQPEVEAELTSTLGDVYYALGKYAQAEAMYRRALVIWQSLYGQEHPVVARSLQDLGGTLRVEGNLVEAENLLRKAMALYQRLLGKTHERIASCLGDLAALAHDQGNLAEAEALNREKLSIQRTLLGDEHQDVAFTLSALGFVLFGEAKLAEAETVLREAVTLQQKLPGQQDLAIAHTLKNLADVLHHENKLAEAETNHRAALEIRRKLLPADHAQIGDSLNDLANLLQEQQRLGEAEALHREALAMFRKVFGEEHAEIAISLGNLGDLLVSAGKLDEAETRFRESIAMIKKVLGDDHRLLAAPLANLARLLMNQGRWVEAEPLSVDALKMRRASLGNNHPMTTRSLASLVDVLLATGRFGEAEPLARECLATRELQIPDDPLTFNARALLGACLLGEKKYAEAEPLLLSGYEGMKQREARIPPEGRYRLKQAMVRLVQLYEATNRRDQAAAWKQKLAAFEKAATESQPAVTGP
jgi:tetratricopeptide (TPR) repeat protein/tRNA A-37 threonylcarbamoyl transferase component Bud32